jgi:hypothetical protein
MSADLIRFEYPGREPGWGVITAFTSAQSVTFCSIAIFRQQLRLESWRLGRVVRYDGLAACRHVLSAAAFHGAQLQPAANDLGSQSGDFQNMRPDSWVAGAKSVQDSNALNFTLASGIAAPITWLMGARRLIAGTAIGQWYISSKGAALTPSDFSADPQSSSRRAMLLRWRSTAAGCSFSGPSARFTISGMPTRLTR